MSTPIQHAHLRFDNHSRDSWAIMTRPESIDSLAKSVIRNRAAHADVHICNDSQCGITAERAASLAFLGQFGPQFAPRS